MKKFLPLLLLIVGCSHAPSKTNITCQSGHGTCYVVHCERRTAEDCESYFPRMCPKGFEQTTYGIVTADQQDRLVECK